VDIISDSRCHPVCSLSHSFFYSKTEVEWFFRTPYNHIFQSNLLHISTHQMSAAGCNQALFHMFHGVVIGRLVQMHHRRSQRCLRWTLLEGTKIFGFNPPVVSTWSPRYGPNMCTSPYYTMVSGRWSKIWGMMGDGIIFWLHSWLKDRYIQLYIYSYIYIVISLNKRKVYYYY
jgi:hypothetical protein